MTLISEDYRALNAKHHAEYDGWGRHSGRYADAVELLADSVGTYFILDYGCGKQELKRRLDQNGFNVVGYDPAFPELSSAPEPQDLVVCSDVLEHIEPDCLDAVLSDLARVTRKVGLFIIATRESLKCLPDGTNPHRIVRPKEWWIEKLAPLFDSVLVFEDAKYFGLVVKPK